MTSIDLPAVDGTDLLHWEQLDDAALRATIAADTWNLAAAIHVQATRHAATAARLAADIALFSYRAAS